MISFTKGNLLEADVEAVVNTINTVGIMGKGIALMFKERFPKNFEAYAQACKNKDIRLGSMYVTENKELFGPRFIINFPTKTHWRVRTRLSWIQDGMNDLVRTIEENNIRSIAVPPLGCGNGGLEWHVVKPVIVAALERVADLDALIYEPTDRYQNVAKRKGVEKLTPARALVSEIVRRYCILGIDCSILEVQKLGWFLQRGVDRMKAKDPLNLQFSAKRYGPYSHRLTKLLDSLDGSYLRCNKRLSDAKPLDAIWFNPTQKDVVHVYLHSGEGKSFLDGLEWASRVIDGFESPLGMEVLSTVDWLVEKESVAPDVNSLLTSLANWSGGAAAGQRKLKFFNERLVALALERLDASNQESL